MSSSYPVLVLVHGAWHHPSHYKLLVESFSNEGFQDIVTPRNPTSGSIEQVVDKSYPDDVQVIQEAIAPFLDAGRDLVLVAHSYGGVPAASSLKGNTVLERAEKGLRVGIRGLVSIAAFLLPQKGLPLFQPDGTQYGPTFDVQVCHNIIAPLAKATLLIFIGWLCWHHFYVSEGPFQRSEIRSGLA
jgi:alpha-beta hydrolase superfamily lysophospholipase